MNHEKYLNLLKQCTEYPEDIEIFLNQLFQSDHPIFEFTTEKQLDFAESCIIAMTERGYTYRKTTTELTPMYQERAILVINALAATTSPLSTRQLSEITDIPVTWLHNLLIKMLNNKQVDRKGALKFLYFVGDSGEDEV